MLKIILSAELSSLDDATNAIRTEHLRNALQLAGINYLDVNGVYKGVSEKSYITFIDNYDFEKLKTVKRLAFTDFKQECVLIIDNRNEARLLYNDKSLTHIGTWRRVDEPSDSDAYSFINGRFYEVR